MHRSRLVGALLAVVILAAACGSGDNTPVASSAPVTDAAPTTTSAPEGSEATAVTEAPSDSGSDSSGAPVELTDSFRGVTAEAIKIGVVVIDVSVIGRSNGDVEAQWQTAIDAVNDTGGVLGRQLDPVFAFYSPLGDTETEAACIKLAQDEQVFAAMGPLRSSLNCFTELNDTIFINTFGVSQEESDRSTAVAIGPGALPARNASLNVDSLAAAGALDGTIAIHASADAGDELDIWIASLNAAGVDVVTQTQSTVGGDDVVAAEAEMQAFSQVWQSADADTVLAVGAGSGINVVSGIDRGSYRPTLLLTNPSDFDPNLYRDLGYTTDALAGSIAVGFRDIQDLATTGDAGVGECVDRFESVSGETVNIDPAEGEDVNLNTTVWACQSIDIFTQVAEAAGADLTNDSFRAAAESLGPVTVTAIEEASIGAGKFDLGDTPPLLLTFDADADDFVALN